LEARGLVKGQEGAVVEILDIGVFEVEFFDDDIDVDLVTYRATMNPFLK